MVWKPTATTITWPPVRHSQSGARRWSGSATCGPLKVRMLTFAPLNLPLSVHAAAAWLGAAEALAAGDAAVVGAVVGAAVAAVEATGDGVDVVEPHPDNASTRPIAGAIVLSRDTGFLLLTLRRVVQHTERRAVGCTVWRPPAAQ